MKSKPVSRGRRILLISLAGLFLMCIACVALSAASNRGLPQAASSDKLSELDKARLAEALHLKAQLGDGIWPGWGSAEISGHFMEQGS